MNNHTSEMLEALKVADNLVKIARKYFPKSIRNNDKFQLENACATIGNILAKVKSEVPSC
jgi:hypothetical protein